MADFSGRAGTALRFMPGLSSREHVLYSLPIGVAVARRRTYWEDLGIAWTVIFAVLFWWAVCEHDVVTGFLHRLAAQIWTTR